MWAMLWNTKKVLNNTSILYKTAWTWSKAKQAQDSYAQQAALISHGKQNFLQTDQKSSAKTHHAKISAQPTA